jgi:hypothetical protein
MWTHIRSLFGGGEAARMPASDFDAIKADVERVLQLDLTSRAARETHREIVVGTLKRLDAAVEDVRRQADGYPENPISGAVWVNGVGCANMARALTQHFKDAGWLEREENASLLWAKATLAVCSHCHDLVGPAMLANADCHDRLGKSQRATEMYRGVVKDFAFLVESYRTDDEPPTDGHRVALESLRTAIERLLSRQDPTLEGIDLRLLQTQTETILSRTDKN